MVLTFFAQICQLVVTYFYCVHEHFVFHLGIYMHSARQLVSQRDVTTDF